jgi:hypothetical protein
MPTLTDVEIRVQPAIRFEIDLRMKMKMMRGLFLFMMIGVGGVQAVQGQEQPGLVRIAAVQIKGYDKGDLPRIGYDPTTAILPYIDRAGQEGAQLVVFPEYVLGHIHVPGAATDKIAAAAAAHHIYVVIGG